MICSSVNPMNPHTLHSVVDDLTLHANTESECHTHTHTHYFSCHPSSYCTHIFFFLHFLLSDCELVALLEDDTGMELLVCNKIVSLDLPVKEVFKKIWCAQPNVSENQLTHGQVAEWTGHENIVPETDT